MTDKLKIASFSIVAGAEMQPLSDEDLRVLAVKIKGKVAEAVNVGKDVSMAVFIHPQMYIPTSNLLLLESMEGSIIRSDSNHLILRTDQGGRIVMVQFVGGSSPFRITHAVEEESTGEEDDSVASIPRNSNNNNNNNRHNRYNRHNRHGINHRDADSDSSSSAGEEFPGLSQLHIS
ncbi:hypothetical protein SEMRO_1070_G237770.1 [Seminavis robusta]|uniref:Uncharacterized protein n=1 Tax=Seminavis robusta TaxID=568900 RepID=A0A9N8EEM8_9STRA|nr:hypothetical protein SEMRO_1070_G237770.1 [Seminavis robusta]|eukprot:Sro1070_g237770.1 n/a (176) ;mRNA; f:21468-21995